ncbi:MAG TPA: peptidase M16 [Porphyromonadaceae bacterium]|nr:peptidase M16 [Porphyromonadaceae bacterium]
MEYESHTLRNGIRVVHLPLKSEVAYCGFVIGVGSRDEKNGEEGMAHFVEHMLFKGTHKHTASYILNRIESVGGELNAYTTKEHICVYSTFLCPYFDRAVDLLGDIVFNSTFPERELRKEANVICEEINSYKDTPSELIFDDFENLLFQNHPLGHNILGEEEDIEEVTSEELLRFLQSTYNPEEIVFFSLGKMNFKTIVRKLDPLGEVSFSSSYKREKLSPAYTPFKKIVKKDTFQTHVLLGNLSYTFAEEKEKIALGLLNNILGGPNMNSVLNMALREKKAWVYEVESNVTCFSDTGMFSIYFACDRKNEGRCLSMVMKELKHFQNEALSTLKLDRAKKQLYGQFGIANDNHESLALVLGKSFLQQNYFESLKERMIKFEKITSSDLLEVANYVFDEDKLSILSYH